MLCINIAQQIFHFLIYTDNVSGKIIYGAVGRKVISLYLNLQKEYMYIYIVVYTVIEKNGLLTSISNNKQVFPPFFLFFGCKTILFDWSKVQNLFSFNVRLFESVGGLCFLLV